MEYDSVNEPSIKKVLDKGYVRLVDMMGSDLSVANAARASFAKESTELSEYLGKNKQYKNKSIKMGKSTTIKREIEINQLATDPAGEFDELVHIYMNRGLSENLAKEVVTAMHNQNALEAHLRDELGHFDHTRARPVQAAVASAIAFTAGGVVPLIGALISSSNQVNLILVFTALGLLGAGFISAKIAASPIPKTIVRIFMGGALGVTITAGIGWLVGLTGI